MVSLSEDPANPLEGEASNHCRKIGALLCFEDVKAIVGACLFGFVKGFNDDTDAALIVRVLSVVTVEKGNALLFILARKPVLDEFLDLGDVHKLNVVHMAILLAFDDDVGRDALVAHGFGIGLVVAAGAIDFVPHSGGGKAVVALDLGWMDALAFELALLEPVIEGHVGGIGNELLVQTVHTLGVRAVLAQHLSLAFLVFEVHWSAVETLASGSVVALRSPIFLLLLLVLFLANAHTIEALASRGVVATC